MRAIRLRGVWSYGFGKVTELSDLDKFTVIVGKNNSGKSNILNAVRWLRASAAKLLETSTDVVELTSLDLHDDGTGRTEAPKPELLANVEIPESVIEDFFDRKGIAEALRSQLKEKILAALDEGISVGIDETHEERRGLTNFVRPASGKAVTTSSVDDISGSEGDALHAAWGGALDLGFWREVLGAFENSVVDISGWRALGPEIISDLHAMQVPSANKRADNKIFRRIEAFFQRATGLRDAQLLPSPDPESPELQIRTSHITLPIGSFGDGIQHLLLIAYYALRGPRVVLLEEPETQLHPELQRHLLALLKEESTTAQFLVTTHSPVLLDGGRWSRVFHVERQDHESEVTTRCAGSAYAILDDLGARASDVLQANVVIWVEGPTDRMFLRHCLSLLEPGLREGTHYHVMFYGGRLLRHISLDESLDMLVSLLPLGRRVVVVCDSDREKEEDELTEAKIRIRSECKVPAALCWITDGREIENYLPNRVLQSVYRKWFGAKADNLVLPRHERLQDVLKKADLGSRRGKAKWAAYGRNKIDVMPKLLEELAEADLDVLDLRERLEEVLKFIHEANLTTPS